LTKDSMVEGTLVFEKLRTVPVHFMVEPGKRGPEEETAPTQAATPGDHAKSHQ
jgi:hypothetical protein